MKKTILIILTLISTQTFAQLQTTKDIVENNDNYVLLNQTLKNQKKLLKDRTIILKKSSDNQFVVSIIQAFKTFDSELNKTKLDSLKQDIGADKDNTLNEIFNKKEYDYLISQKTDGNWDFQKINVPEIFLYEKDKRIDRQVIVKISKPIYTINRKYALLLYSITGKHGGILVYKKVNNEWLEHKLISPMLY